MHWPQPKDERRRWHVTRPPLINGEHTRSRRSANSIASTSLEGRWPSSRNAAISRMSMLCDPAVLDISQLSAILHAWPGIKYKYRMATLLMHGACDRPGTHRPGCRCPRCCPCTPEAPPCWSRQALCSVAEGVDLRNSCRNALVSGHLMKGGPEHVGPYPNTHAPHQPLVGLLAGGVADLQQVADQADNELDHLLVPLLPRLGVCRAGAGFKVKRGPRILILNPGACGTYPSRGSRGDRLLAPPTAAARRLPATQ
jgi:hypothetical protein